MGGSFAAGGLLTVAQLSSLRVEVRSPGARPPFASAVNKSTRRRLHPSGQNQTAMNHRLLFVHDKNHRSLPAGLVLPAARCGQRPVGPGCLRGLLFPAVFGRPGCPAGGPGRRAGERAWGHRKGGVWCRQIHNLPPSPLARNPSICVCVAGQGGGGAARCGRAWRPAPAAAGCASAC